MIGSFEWIVALPFLAGLLAATAFWIWVLADCVAHEPPTWRKVWWILFILSWYVIGASIYFMARRSARVERRPSPPVSRH